MSKEEEAEIIAGHTKKVVRDKVLGLFKIGEIVSEIINWNDSIDEDLKEAKKEYLLAQYFEKNDENEEALKQIKNFISRPQGNTLFNKILRIMDDSPPDIELSKHLSSSLEYMCKSNFEKMFETHKYALAQIEKMTPQALTILSDNKNWPAFALPTRTTVGIKVTSEYLAEFTRAYCTAKGITEQALILRIKHSVNELIGAQMIEAQSTQAGSINCVVTGIGKTLLPYINA